MTRALLLTGGTGFVGKALLRRLLEQPELRVYALARASPRPWQRRLGLDEEALARRVRPLFGDLRHDGLGLEPAAIAALEAEPALEVWHSAALTDLSPDASEATLSANTLGTVQLLRLLARLPTPPSCLNLISTIGVAGRTQAPERVPEALLDRPRFWSPYEESKYWAELLVARSGLAYKILRLPIVVGDARTGESDDKTVYALLAALCLARAELLESGQPARLRVRARPEALNNLICVDDLVSLMLELRADARPGGFDRVYHLTNPKFLDAASILGVCAELAGLELHADPAFEPPPEGAEAQLHAGLAPLRPYMNRSTPHFERAAVAERCATRPRPVDAALLRELLEAFLTRRPGLRP